MRAAVVDVRKSPPGVNLAYPLRAWTLTGGATYDPATDTVALPVGGAVELALGVSAKTDGRRWRIGFEIWEESGTAGRLVATTRYYDREMQLHVTPGGWNSNGHLTSSLQPNRWQDHSYLSPNDRWDEQLIYLRFLISNDLAYNTAPATIRNPVITTV